MERTSKSEAGVRPLKKKATPYELASALNKNENSRERILKQLEQLGVDVAEYERMPLKELASRVDEIMRNTYSVKYLGLNRNEMGIISRRINPLSDGGFKVHLQGQAYSIHKYFYPKPLRTGKKMHHNSKINLDNLEGEIKKQFEQNREQTGPRKSCKVMEKSRTALGGSWLAHQKSNQENLALKHHLNHSLQPTGIYNLSDNIQAPAKKVNSYSRFLKEGVLLTRD